MSFGVFAHTTHAGILEGLAILVVELETVAVTLTDVSGSVGLGGNRILGQHAVVGTQTHGSAHVGDALLLLHQVDDVVFGGHIHLGRVGIGQAHHVAGILDDHALHTQADTKGRYIVLTGILEGYKLAFDTALSETRSDYYTVERREHGVDIAAVQLLGVDVLQIELAVVVGSGLEERLVDGLVGIGQLDILTHQTDTNRFGGIFHAVEEVHPRLQMGLAIDGQAGLGEHELVEMLLVHLQRDFVNRGHVDRLDDSGRVYITEEGHLLAQVQREVVLGTQHQNIGLDTHLLQLFYRVLGRFGLQLFGGSDIGHIGKVYAHTVLAQLPPQLTHALEIGQRLDVAHGTADFGNHKVELVFRTQQLDVAFDFVGNMRNDLYRFS